MSCLPSLRDSCIKANRCVAFGIRLWSHTEVCSLQTSPSAPCASSFLQSLDNLASKIVRLLTFATVSLSEYSPQLFVIKKYRHFLFVLSEFFLKNLSELFEKTLGTFWENSRNFFQNLSVVFEMYFIRLFCGCLTSFFAPCSISINRKITSK